MALVCYHTKHYNQVGKLVCEYLTISTNSNKINM